MELTFNWDVDDPPKFFTVQFNVHAHIIEATTEDPFYTDDENAQISGYGMEDV